MANLILTICSNHKRLKGAVSQYDSSARKITDILPDDMGEKIIDARKRAFEHITKPNRGGRSMAGTPLNKTLVFGPDLNPCEQNQGGIYMPALKRYDGRFFVKFQHAVGDIDDFIRLMSGESDNHLIIVSGLYGLLGPAEPIQRYNCHIPDEPEIKRLWKKDSLLTKLVISYMHKFGINRVFDFMADDSYRHLIDWKLIEKEAYSTVFYPRCHKQIGVDMLPELGRAAGLLLSGQTKIELSNITFGPPVAGIAFSKDEPEWIPAGTTFSKREICAVWALRMATNIDEFMNREKIPEKKSAQLKYRIGVFRSKHNKNEAISKNMDEVNDFRNAVVHRHCYVPRADNLLHIRKCYGKIVKWATKKGYEELEDVDY